MHLIDELEHSVGLETSPFRAQMLREDIVRLRKLEEIVRSEPDLDAVRRAVRRLGWTALDARTQELAAPLDRLVDAVLRSRAAPATGIEDSAIRDAWLELTRLRIERMVGCLSTRLSEPSEE